MKQICKKPLEKRKSWKQAQKLHTLRVGWVLIGSCFTPYNEYGLLFQDPKTEKLMTIWIWENESKRRCGSISISFRKENTDEA